MSEGAHHKKTIGTLRLRLSEERRLVILVRQARRVPTREAGPTPGRIFRKLLRGRES